MDFKKRQEPPVRYLLIIHFTSNYTETKTGKTQNDTPGEGKPEISSNSHL